MNKYSKKWNEPYKKSAKGLSGTIEGIEKLKAGRQLDPNMESNMQTAIEGLDGLQSNLAEIDRVLNTIIELIDIFENVSRDLAPKTPFPKDVYALADSVEKGNDNIISFREIITGYSSTLSGYENKINELSNYASNREMELYGLWVNGNSGVTKANAAIAGIAIILIFGFKKKSGPDLNKMKKNKPIPKS